LEAFCLSCVVSDQRYQCKVQAQSLAAERQQGKLDANAPWQAARPHFVTRVGIGTFYGSGNCIIPDVPNAVPAEKDAVEKGNKL